MSDEEVKLAECRGRVAGLREHIKLLEDALRRVEANTFDEGLRDIAREALDRCRAVSTLTCYSDPA